MDMLRRNLFFIICGVVAVAGIALAALGLSSMTEVRDRMGAAGALLQNLRRASSGETVNLKAIEDVNRKVAAIQANYRRVFDWAHRLNRRPPLVQGVFPDPRGQKKLEFRDAYQAELERLIELLNAGEPPTRREIDDMRDIIKNERPRRGDPFAARPDRGDEESAEPQNKSGLITDDEARQSPQARAALVKAQSFYCYANLDYASLEDASFQVIANAYAGGIETPPETLWDAQRTLWVQQDVVEAIARANEKAAGALRQQGIQPWVGVLPVKDLISIRVSDYVFEDSDGSAPASPGADGPAKPPGTRDESFTGYYSNELYDVLQFTVKLVVDARQVPIIIDEICKDRFYTPLRVAYLVEPANLSMTGKIYGEDPVVRMVADFEAYYFGDIYRRLMPDRILEEIGRERPVNEEASTD